MLNKNFTSFILLLLLGTIWGTGYTIARFATTHNVPPLGYSFWQSLGPALLISALCWVNSRSRIKISTLHLRYYFISGLTGIAIPNTNMYFAAEHLSANLLAVIVNTVPVIAYPMALLARVESFSIVRIASVFSVITGLLFIILPKTSLPTPDMAPWAVIALITPISFAFCAVYISRFRPERGDSLSLAAGTLIASSILLLPLVLLKRDFYFFHLPFTSSDWVILLEIILSSVGYILFFQLIKLAGPVYYSLVNGVVALTGLFWGYLIFNEKLNDWTMVAVGFILLALVLVTNRKKL